MIRFKKTDAAAVPVPPADYATLFVDAATGLPAAKDSAGTVVPLKGADGAPGAPGAPGTGLPDGGTVGQVVTKTEGGAAWADAPAAGGGPAGTWLNLLPPDGELLDYDSGDPLVGAATGMLVYGNDASGTVGFTGKRIEVRDKYSSLERVALTIVLDVQMVGGAELQPRAFLLKNDYSVTKELLPGLNEITYTVARNSVANEEGMYAELYVTCVHPEGVASAWVSVEVTQAELFVHDVAVEADNSPLTMTPIAIQGIGNGGSGGCHIPKEGPLATATTIEIVGYYSLDASPLIDASELYASRWLDAGDYTAVTPTEIPVGGEDSSFEGDWGWAGGREPLPLPGSDENDPIPFIAMLSVDGASPVIAVLNNLGG